MGRKAAPPSGADDYLRFYEPHPEQPLSPEDGFRVVPVFGDAEGYRELIHLRDGFDLVLGNVIHRRDAEIVVPEDAVLKFHFRLTGHGRISFDEGQPMDVRQQTAAVLLHPPGAEKHQQVLAGEQEQSITLLCSPPFLAKVLHGMEAELPTALTDYLRGKSPDYYHVSLPLRADMSTAVSAMLQCEMTGGLRRVYAEARAMDLLFLALQALMDAESGADRPDRGLTQLDVDRLNKACDILRTNFVAPPTIQELGREIGMNEAKLMRCFKQLFGQTIFDFAQHLRMAAAKELLESTERSITEIAFDVGYEYSSNFATAFKRHYGITPRAARDAVRD